MKLSAVKRLVAEGKMHMEVIVNNKVRAVKYFLKISLKKLETPHRRYECPKLNLYIYIIGKLQHQQEF